MERSSKRTGRIGVAFTSGSARVGSRVSTLRSAIRSQNARVARMASRVSRLRRRNSITAGYLGIEVKYYDTAFGSTYLSSPANPDSTLTCDPPGDLCLNAVKQGDGPTNRDGKKIRLRSLYIKGVVFREGLEATTTSQEPCHAYVAVVLDRQTNASQIAPGQVFTNPLGNSSGIGQYFRNLEYAARYKILRDQVFSFNGGPVAALAGPALYPAGMIRHFEWYIPLNIDVLFNTVAPTTATIADITNNSIHVLAGTNLSAVPNKVAMYYSARIRFVG